MYKNKYKEAFRLLFDDYYMTPKHWEDYEILKELIDKQEKYRWHNLRKDPNDLPNGREWVLAIFKEPDTDFTLAPRVADYIGKQTAITTKENWIIIDLDDVSNLSEYHRNLECIAWKYIEGFGNE